MGWSDCIPMSRFLLIALLLLTLIPAGKSATIEGRIYSWETFEPVKSCIVTLNSTPLQKIVAVNGSYSFEAPPGVYRIEVVCYSDQNLFAEETIEIRQNGTFHIDMLAQPPIEELNVTVPEINLTFDEEMTKNPYTWNLNTVFLYAVPAVLAATVLVYYHLSRRERAEISDDEVLPEDLNEIIEIIRKEGGRITQKELRKRTGYSDAKISLMIADLEKRGKVEKVKKGRGNIIFLKE